MRDLVFFLFFLAALYFTFKKPFIGISLWLWVTLFNPKGWMYGFGAGIRYNLIIVIATITAFAIAKNKGSNQWSSLTWLILLFLLWTFITSLFTISSPSVVWPEWIEFLKICLLYFFATSILQTKTHLDMLIWGLVLSLGFYSSLQAVKYILSGGGHIINGMAGHTLGDRNDLAVAIILLIPLIAYLASVTEHKLIKLGLVGIALLCVAAVLGSGSRGGFIGVTILAGYFWLNSQHKVLFLVMIPIIAIVGWEFMPESWHARMSTIENADQDMSFLGRIMAWKQAILMASENITGGGFKAGQDNVIWFLYDPQQNLNWLFDTSNVPFIKAFAAHSIYFQVLGDHGFIGLLLFLLLLLMAFSQARSVQKKLRKQPKLTDLAKLSSMIRVSLLAYAVSGAAVSMAYFDMLYGIFAIIHVLSKISNDHENKQKAKLPLRSQ